MKSFISTPIRCSLVLLIVALLVSGCSGSSDSNSGESQTDGDVSAANGNGIASDGVTDSVENEMEDASIGDTTSGTQTESTDGSEESTTESATGSTTGTGSTLDSEQLSTTRVNFEITVPVYSSNTLQVRLVWGDIDITAMWDIDQRWTVSADFPVNTTNQLVVTFNDDNGAVTLGSFETSFTTIASQSEFVQIGADEFDTDRWDSDGDGVSNLSELMGGTVPDEDVALQPVRASLEIVPDKTFRISWQATPGARYYRVLENSDGTSGFTDISGQLYATSTDFDHRVALFKRLNGRYMVEACNTSTCALSNELSVEGSLVGGVGSITASNAEASDGATGVTISADGNTLAFGALGEASAATGIDGDQQDNSSERSGAVYVFKRENGSWQQQAYIKASRGDADDLFGRELSLNGDGTILAVGVEEEDSAASGIDSDQSDNSLFSVGAVYVFTLADGSWQQQAYIKASNPTQSAHFGSRVDLSAEGNTLAVLARSESTATSGINGDQSQPINNNTMYSGAVYIFERTNNNWQQEAFIKPDVTAFGYTFIGLSEKGNTLAVGRYVFSRSGSTWRQDVYFDRDVIGAHSTFGGYGALSDDGTTLVISADGDENSATGINPTDPFATATLDRAGAVHIFGLVNGSWAQQAYLKPSVTQNYTYFGATVSISADGNTLAVFTYDGTDSIGIFTDHTSFGGTFDPSVTPSDDTHAVYIFRREFGNWRQSAYVKPTLSGYRLGDSLALDGNGDTLVIVQVPPRTVNNDSGSPIEPALSGVNIY